ncbi:ribosomal RNA large subunit methyltransferase J [Polynucleobacter sp. SHI8]|uniref:23S rRNA (adenine(2030)-N(6))-methyltransferase RlmJ n=1 Tax=unclassified Polynucleobacter TaxID=2640945 RepID=UPI00248FE482|nr:MULTISPECIES: 23S rRNA (adenine(2030)-N(6))-methyltransferase RlmJ [unclassified Polynucleobacter]BDW10987.1 ribosomal RNA large subunit methyltransferase J [Polynucleobacter sp. SHI2]BDW13433.1 ribosomal RNA large subunit methyltransferase J [Polynucleobacter sp. SHI8]
MFSYRHGFHAGNHADVLKHLTLLTCLELLHKKETPLMLIDTHAGAGIYNLQDRFATTSLESEEGIAKLFQMKSSSSLTDNIRHYLSLIENLQTPSNPLEIYPGSPYLLWQSMRSLDKLRLMELHPTDFPVLKSNIESIQLKRQDIKIELTNGFTHLKAYLPPPSRRALVLIDPSYEDKGDYFQVIQTLQEALKRFSTGVYVIWYPILSRLDAQEFPDRLRKLCSEFQLPWLSAELRIKNHQELGLSASGVWVINPPWKLKETLELDLPVLQSILEIDGMGQHLITHHE